MCSLCTVTAAGSVSALVEATAVDVITEAGLHTSADNLVDSGITTIITIITNVSGPHFNLCA